MNNEHNKIKTEAKHNIVIFCVSHVDKKQSAICTLLPETMNVQRVECGWRPHDAYMYGGPIFYAAMYL